MPGTLGTLVGIPLFLFLSRLSWPLYFLTTIAFTFFAIWISDKALPYFENKKRPEDPACIVIDEVAGYLWAAGILCHLGFWAPSQGLLSFLIISFGLFRFFDILKRGPVRWAEQKFKGGVGIVLDDVFAGILAGITGILFCILYPFVAHMGYILL